jgi:hypothetical protein
MATKEQLEKHKQFLLDQDQKRRQADIARQQDVLSADYSGYNSLDDIWRGLSTAEINLLKTQSPSYKKRIEELDLINAFKRLTEEDQATFFAEANEATRITLENDGYVASQTMTLAPSPDEAAAKKAADLAAENLPVLTAEEQIEQDRQAEAVRLQAETDRLAAEATAAGVRPAVLRGTVEELYPGVEKLGEGSYKLTVDPEDGSNPEIFYGASQKECFIALRKSKANATKELRRRAKKIQITEELRNLEAETVEYAPLLKPLSLTPDQIFTLTEQLKDPTKVLEAHAKLRQASITPEECARQNESIERQRYSDAFNTAQTWLKLRPDFYNHPDNIKALKDLMGELGWAVTMKNLDLAFEVLLEQDGALLDRPEPQQEPPVAQPALVVPVAPVVVPVAPVVVPPAPTGALPAAPRILRPGSLAESSTGIQPSVRMTERTGRPPAAQPMSAEEYAAIPAAEVSTRYRKDLVFKARVDAYWAAGGR